MHAELWGPGMWHILFSCAWNAPDCKKKPVPLLHEMLDLAGVLLPCQSCRANHERHMKALRQRYERPESCGKFFEFLFYLKDMVNRTLAGESTSRLRLSARTPPFTRLTERYVLRGDAVDECLVSDTLLLVAIDASERELVAEYQRFCHVVGQLLPSTGSSPLKTCLKSTTRGAIVSAYRTYGSVRSHVGLGLADLDTFQRAAKA